MGALIDKKCTNCGDAKAAYTCISCNRPVCKKCHEYVDEETFALAPKLPPKVKLGNFCPHCFDEQVAPAKAAYDELAEKAKDVYFLTKAYRGFVRVLQRHTKRVSVESCHDRRLTIERMAYVAAQLGFNPIIEAEVDHAKVRINKYQTTMWSGSALPAKIDGEQLERSALRRI